MEYPATGRDALEALKEHFGEEELVDLEKKSGVSYETLRNWSLGKGKFTVKGKRHWQRIFGEGAAPHHAREPAAPYAVTPPPSLSEVHQVLVEVRDLLRSLLTLEAEGRLGETVGVKRRRKAGGGAA